MNISPNDLPSCLRMERIFPDIHEEIHSLLSSSVQKFVLSSHKVLSTAVSWLVVVNKKDTEGPWRLCSHEEDMKETIK